MADRVRRVYCKAKQSIDLCPREPVAVWAAYLRTSHPTLIFSTSGDGPGVSKESLGVTAALKLLGEWSKEKGEDLVVAVVGTTNVSPYPLVLSFAN